MKLTHRLAVALALTALACQSTSTPNVVQADAAKRDRLLSAVSALEGRWRGASPDGQTQYTEFAVTSAGSVVREVMMPGEEHEMVNMYALDGNSLVMTHYCAGGNQPRMRATSIEDGRMSFVADGVSDLKAKDEIYMGAMTLEIVDEGRIVQHWSALKGGEPDHEMVIEMTRVN
jgi:hypothetical protein